MKEVLGVDKLPPAIGIIWLGEVITWFTDSTHLNDLYVNKNENVTRFYLNKRRN